jgi:hypothetical protein
VAHCTQLFLLDVMFARHANPHVQHISERVVSRREILDEEDIEEDQSRDAAALKELDELIMRSMGVAAPLPLPPVAPTVDEPPRKTKRRKTKHQAVVAESDTVRESSHSLLSTTTQRMAQRSDYLGLPGRLHP